MKQFFYMFLFATIFLVQADNDSFARGNASILAVAKSQIGVREYRGRGSNPRITGYFRRAVGRRYSDSMPWCAAFIGYVVKQAGHRGTNSLSARSYLRWGRRTRNPRPGDLVVFRRRRGGHVGIFVGFSGNRVRVIGGNQSNRVSYKSYPRYRVMGYRTSGRGSSIPQSRYARKKRKSNKKYRLARRKIRRNSRRIAANNKKRRLKRRRVAALKKRKRRRRRQTSQQNYAPARVYTPPVTHLRYAIDGSTRQ